MKSNNREKVFCCCSLLFIGFSFTADFFHNNLSPASFIVTFWLPNKRTYIFIQNELQFSCLVFTLVCLFQNEMPYKLHRHHKFLKIQNQSLVPHSNLCKRLKCTWLIKHPGADGKRNREYNFLGHDLHSTIRVIRMLIHYHVKNDRIFFN